MVQSARLFALYAELIINKIDETKIGIKIGKTIIPILVYADDIILLTETKYEMNKLLKVVSEVGKFLQIKFNPDKTMCMAINQKIKKRTKKYMADENIKIEMDNNQIEIVI